MMLENSMSIVQEPTMTKAAPRRTNSFHNFEKIEEADKEEEEEEKPTPEVLKQSSSGSGGNKGSRFRNGAI
jgi:hypothetical protein